MLTFTDEWPDPFEGAIEQVRARPGEWAYMTDLSRRRIEGLRKRFPDIEIRGTGLNPSRTRYAKAWFRCPAP